MMFFRFFIVRDVQVHRKWVVGGPWTISVWEGYITYRWWTLGLSDNALMIMQKVFLILSLVDKSCFKEETFWMLIKKRSSRY